MQWFIWLLVSEVSVHDFLDPRQEHHEIRARQIKAAQFTARKQSRTRALDRKGTVTRYGILPKVATPRLTQTHPEVWFANPLGQF